MKTIFKKLPLALVFITLSVALTFALYIYFILGKDGVSLPAGEDNHSRLVKICQNVQNQIGDDYFAGAYFTGETKDETVLHLLVTDVKKLPEIDDDRVVITEAKYSLNQLRRYIDIVTDEIMMKRELGGVGVGIDQEYNKIIIEVLEGFDESGLKELLPDDAYILDYEGIIRLMFYTVNNAISFFTI